MRSKVAGSKAVRNSAGAGKKSYSGVGHDFRDGFRDSKSILVGRQWIQDSNQHDTAALPCHAVF